VAFEIALTAEARDPPLLDPGAGIMGGMANPEPDSVSDPRGGSCLDISPGM
jgi:hypothetical protein